MAEHVDGAAGSLPGDDVTLVKSADKTRAWCEKENSSGEKSYAEQSHGAVYAARRKKWFHVANVSDAHRGQGAR